MSESIYDILEICIAALDQGESLEACLARYPQYADELRPLLQTVAQTYEAAVFDIPEHVRRGGRARLLNYAAALRERGALKPRAALGSIFARAFNKAAAVIALLLVLVLGGTTGLVYASNGSLPGDGLYPVKRTWENIRLQFVFDPVDKDSLKNEYAQERVAEINGLIARGRVEQVDFTGPLTGIFPDRLIVSEIIVFFDSQTHTSGAVALNQLVEVIGMTRADGTVLAQQILIVRSEGADAQSAATPQGGDSRTRLPESKTVEPSETPEPQATPKPESPSGSKTPQSTLKASKSPEPQNQFKLEGVVQQMNQNNWVVSDQHVLIDPHAEINGSVVVGATVKIEGYVDGNGNLIATNIELRSTPAAQTPTPTAGSGGGNGGGGSDDHGGGDTPTPDH